MNKISKEIIITTILREHGETGVQTHFNAFREYLNKVSQPSILVNPFSAPAWLVYPLFSLRTLISIIHKPSSIWWYRHWHFQCLKLALKKVVRGRPCVIYAQCPLSALAALQVRPSAEILVVMVAHFNISQANEFADKKMIKTGSSYYQSIQDLESFVLSKIDAIVYVSEFSKAALEIRHPSLISKPSTVCPNFIDPPSGIELDAVHTDLVTIGTLEPRKNQSYLLEILAEAARFGKRYSLSIIGDGKDRKGLEALANQLGIRSQVRFLGFRADAAKLLPGHRAYCHVAKMENSPLAIIEAMSAGLPIFATMAGGVSGIFKDGIEGKFIPLDDSVSAAKMIIDVLEDSCKSAEYSRSAKENFDRNFSSSVLAPILYEFILPR